MFNNINLSDTTISHNFANEFKLKDENYITTTEFIDIPDDIKTFDQLKQYEHFSKIKSEYIIYIGELSKLYYHFTGLGEVNLDSIISQIIGDHNYLDDNILFFSYKIIRKHIYNIVNFLIESKNLINDKTSIICTKLEDCFNSCFEGFNSKILRIGEFISLHSNINEKINIKIKAFIEETIDELLINYTHKINIHEKNALHNMVASDFNFDSISDKYANLYFFNDDIINELVYELNIALSGFNICKLIAEELYSLLEDIITKTGKINWINNYIEEITAESAICLEDYFIDIVNKYLNIQQQEDKITIADLICLIEQDKMYLANIKDKLHFLCAKYMNRSTNCFPKFLNNQSKIIAIADSIAIFSINNKYFYAIENNMKTPIQLSHLEKVNPYVITTEVYISVLLQAFEQTFTTTQIYQFFNNLKQQKIIFSSFNSYFICQELNKKLKKDNDLRARLLATFLECHVKNDINAHKTCRKFIINNIIATEILNHLITNNINVSCYLTKLPIIRLFNFIVSLEISTIEKIFLNKQLYSENAMNRITLAIFYLFVYKRWQVITLLLKSKIKFNFIDSLTDKQKQKALKIILNNRKYSIIDHFLLDYVQLNITDINNNNIIHHAVLHNNLIILKNILKNTNHDNLHKLLANKNYQGLTPLMLSMACTTKTACFDIIIEYCDDDIIGIINNSGSNAIMFAANEGLHQYLEKLISKAKKYDLLVKSDKYGYNSLMLAIKKQNYLCVDIILNNLTVNSLRQIEKIYGSTAIYLAIMHKSKLIEKLINKADDYTLNILSSSLNSVLLIAVQENHEKALELLLQRCSRSLLYQKNAMGYTPLMIAATRGNLNCMQKIFAYADKKLILQTNKNGNNILMLAIQNCNLECVNFLLLNCQKNILKKLYYQTNNFSFSAVAMAKYYYNRAKKDEYQKDQNTIENYKIIIANLNKYYPYHK